MNDITAQAIIAAAAAAAAAGAAAAAEDAAHGADQAGRAAETADLAVQVPGDGVAAMPQGAPNPAAPEPVSVRPAGVHRRRNAQDNDDAEQADRARAAADEPAADTAAAAGDAPGSWAPLPAASGLLAQAADASATPAPVGAVSAEAPASLMPAAVALPGLLDVLLGAAPLAMVAAASGSDPAPEPAPQDTTPPTVRIDVPDRSVSATPTVNGTTDLPDGATVGITLRGADGSTTDYTATVQGGKFSLPLPTALPEGSYTVTATAEDDAGNRATASDTGTVDLMVIAGNVTAGPVVAGHGLSVTVFAADGTVLGSAAVASDGSYRIALQQPHTGLLLVRVSDANATADYRDEASGLARDLTMDLRAVAQADGSNDLRVNVTPATELVVLGLGLEAGDGGGAVARLGDLGMARVAAVQEAVQSALGLPDDFVSASVVATVRVDGSVDPQANLYGQVLAAVSGLSMTQGLTLSEALGLLGAEASDGQLSRTTEVDLVGAALVAEADATAVAVGLGWSSDDAAALVSAWSAVVAAANGSGTPAASDLQWLGVEGAHSQLAIGLLTSALAGRDVESVGSVRSLSALASAADNVVAATSGNGVLALEDLEELGIAGVSAQSLGALEHALLSLGTAALVDGIEGIESIAALVVADSTAPVLTVSSRVATDSGALADIGAGGVTSDRTVSLAGTASDASGTVLIEVFQGSTRLGSTSPDSLGRWTLDVPSLPDGLHALTVRGTDLAGNVTQVSAPAFTVDATRPVITSAALASADENQSTLYVGGASDASLSGGGLTWSVGGADAALLQVDALGRVSLRAGTLDFETRPVYRFDLSATDAAGNTGSLAVTVNVSDLNEGPVIGVGAGAVVEDGTPTASGTLTIVDADDPALAFVAGTQAGAYGSLTLNAAGTWTYTLGPAAQALAGGQVVTDMFTVTLTNGSTTTVTITATGTDDAPVISAGTGSVTEDTSPTASGTLTATDADNPALAFVAGTRSGAYGSLTLNAAGAWTYTLGAAAQALAGGQVVTDTFTVTLSDGSTTTVTITATGINDAPLISSGTGSVTEDTSPAAAGTLTATDADNPGLAFVAGTHAGAYGSLTLNAAGAWTYTLGAAAQALAGGQVVADTFTVTLNDGSTTTVTITATGTDDAPVISSGTGTVTEDASPTATGTLTATDADNPALAFVPGTQSGAYGSLTLNAAGAWTYTLGAAAQALAGGQVVADTFTVTLNDGSATTVTITATGTDDAPVISSGTGAVTEDTSATATGTLTATDADNPALAFVAGTQAGAYGSLTLNAAGAWTYTLGAAAQALAGGQIVTDTFTVMLTDGSTTMVTITATGTDDAPVISSGADAVTEDTSPAATGTLIATDADNPALAFVAGTQTGAYGSLSLSAAGAWTYTLGTAAQALAGGQVVTDTFTVTLTDGSTTTVTITATGTDDTPVVSAGSGAVTEDTAPTTTGTLTATDADDPSLAFVAGTLAGAYGSLVIDATGAWSYTLGPAAQALAGGQVVSEVIAVHLSNGATTTVTLQVTGTEDAPVVSQASVSTSEDGPASVSGTLTATDVDGPPPTFVAGTQEGLYGSFAVSAIGTWTYTLRTEAQSLPEGAIETERFTVTLSNGSTTQVTVMLGGVNDAPVAADDITHALETGSAMSAQPAQGNVLIGADGTLEGRDVDPDLDDGLTVIGIRTGAESGTGAAGVVGAADSEGTPLAGRYGSLVMLSNGAYRYELNNSDPAVQALQSGGALEDVFTYTLMDSSGATDRATLTVRIDGANDAPELLAVTGSADEAGGTGNAIPGTDATGNVLAGATDPDDATSSIAVTTIAALDDELAVAATALAGQSLAGRHGTLVVAADGSYRYVVNQSDPEVQRLLPGDTLGDHFQYTATDSHGATSTASLDFVIHGAEDAVDLQLVYSGNVEVTYEIGSGAVAVLPGDPGIAIDYIDRASGPGANSPNQFTVVFTVSDGRHPGDLLSLEFDTGLEALAAATTATWDEVSGALSVTVQAVPGLDLDALYPQVFAALRFATTDTTAGTQRQIQIDLDDGRGQASDSIGTVLTLADAFAITGFGSGATAENQAYGATLGLSGASGAVSWSIVGGADQSLFTLDAGGHLTLSARNYEAPADADHDNVYRVRVRGTDQTGQSDTRELTVTVTNVEDVATTLALPATVASATEDAAFSFTGASLMSQGTFVDDGGVSLAALRLSNVSGTLTLNGSAYNAITNATVTASSNLVWTPAANVNGASIRMFDVTAVASDGQQSASTVGAYASVAAAPDASSLSLLPWSDYDVSGDPAQRPAILAAWDVDGAMTLSITITGSYSTALGDRLFVDDSPTSGNGGAFRFSQSWDSASGTLTITSAAGQSPTQTNWNAYLGFVRFETSDNDTSHTRTLVATLTSGPDWEVRTSAPMVLAFTDTLAAMALPAAVTSEVTESIDPGGPAPAETPVGLTLIDPFDWLLVPHQTAGFLA